MPPAAPKLILASTSPRRRELLAEAGYCFEVVAPCESSEDAPRPGEGPADLVARLAVQKARDVARRTGTGVVVACDTVVACEGKLLGKPRDESQARAMLTRLAGRRHQVYSGLCVYHAAQSRFDVRVAVTQLAMLPLSGNQIEEYLAQGLWRGKAGAFGYQDGLPWVSILEGSESNVVGLPLELLAEMLSGRPGPSGPAGESGCQ